MATAETERALGLHQFWLEVEDAGDVAWSERSTEPRMCGMAPLW